MKKWQAEAREYLKKLASSPDLRASWQEYMVVHPVRICPDCKGQGYNLTRRGMSTGPCEPCRGYGRLFLTEDEIRSIYREVREYACRKFNVKPKVFDVLVKRKLRRHEIDNPTPGHYLDAARYLARYTDKRSETSREEQGSVLT